MCVVPWCGCDLSMQTEGPCADSGGGAHHPCCACRARTNVSIGSPHGCGETRVRHGHVKQRLRQRLRRRAPPRRRQLPPLWHLHRVLVRGPAGGPPRSPHRHPLTPSGSVRPCVRSSASAGAGSCTEPHCGRRLWGRGVATGRQEVPPRLVLVSSRADAVARRVGNVQHHLLRAARLH